MHAAGTSVWQLRGAAARPCYYASDKEGRAAARLLTTGTVASGRLLWHACWAVFSGPTNYISTIGLVGPRLGPWQVQNWMPHRATSLDNSAPHSAFPSLWLSLPRDPCAAALWSLRTAGLKIPWRRRWRRSNRDPRRHARCAV